MQVFVYWELNANSTSVKVRPKKLLDKSFIEFSKNWKNMKDKKKLILGDSAKLIIRRPDRRLDLE